MLISKSRCRERERVKTGGDEDSRIYMPLDAFTAWTGVGPSVIELAGAWGS